jgi:hypothetical protein
MFLIIDGFTIEKSDGKANCVEGDVPAESALWRIECKSYFIYAEIS